MSPIFAAGTLQAENGMIQVTASDDSAVLRCSLYGYLPLMAVPSITWQLSNNELSNDLVNTITSEQGDMFIQNGGAQPIPSFISTLTVNLTRDPLTTGTRIYNCISSQMNNVTMQTIILSECNTDLLYPTCVVVLGSELNTIYGGIFPIVEYHQKEIVLA